MSEIEYKTAEVYSKFNNGKLLYNTNVMFRQIVNMMVEGTTVFEIVEQIVTSSERHE